MKKISIVIPVFNEAEVIESFYTNLLIPSIKNLSYDFEVIFIDDGSLDNTYDIIYNICEKNPNTKLISFSRNFGKENAITAGLHNIRNDSDAVILLDSDGQHPPKYIKELIRKWESGSDIVVTVRSDYKNQSLIKRIGSSFFYKIMNRLDKNNLTPGAMDFCLIDKIVVDEFNKLTEHNRINRGLLSWVGFKKDFIEIKIEKRMGGRPSYNFKKLLGLALDSFASMSITPLIIFGYIGFGITLLSGLLGVFVIIEQFIMRDPLNINFTGTACLSILVTFLVGLILISQSVTALYVAHIHRETQGRPLYILNKKKSINIKNDK